MLKANQAKWTAATVDDQTSSSALVSDDSDNRKSRDCPEVEALKQIYEQICAIRHSHSQIVAENSAKRAEIQQRFEMEKRKLEEMEAEHRETGRSMKDLSTESDDQATVMLKYRHEQQELEHQRSVLDDLEFQTFEIDAHYDEQKEQIQQLQLVMEQQIISDVDRVYSMKTNHDTTPVVATSFMSQDDCANRDLECLSKELLNDSRSAGDDEEQCSSETESGQTNSSSDVLSLPEEHVHGHTEPGEQRLVETTLSSCDESDVIDVCPPPPPTSLFCSLPGPDLTFCVTRHTPPITPRTVRQHSDDYVTEIDETLTSLTARDGDADNAQPLQQQVIVEADNRESVSRRLLFHQQRTAQNDDVIILRNQGAQTQTQSRPLTRYLPVRGEPLDLLSFVEQAGHFVVRCAADISVTSDSAAGFLVKMGGRIRTWRRRWFVFDRKDRRLAYYVDQTHASTRKPKGSIEFQRIQDVFVFNRLSSIKSPAPDLTFCVKTTSRTYYIVAPSSEVRQLWMEIIFTGAEGYQEFF